MSKIRVYEVAKELNVSSKVVIDELKKLNIDVHSHMSSLSEDQERMVKNRLKDNNKTDKQKPQTSKEHTNKDRQKDNRNTTNYRNNEKNNYRNNTNNKRDNDKRYNNNNDNRVNQRNNDNRNNYRSKDSRSDNRNKDSRSDNRNKDNRNNNNYRSNDNRNTNNRYNNRNNDNRNNDNRNNDNRYKNRSNNKSNAIPTIPPSNTATTTKDTKGRRGNGYNTKDKKAVRDDVDVFERYEKPKKKKSKKSYRKQNQQVIEETRVETKIETNEVITISIPEKITVKDLAEKIGKTSSEIIKSLMLKGIMANLNQEIDFEVAEEVALEFNILVEKEIEVDLLEEYFNEEPDKEEDLTGRSPVVVVMGHVDHGKTSLLDAIRETNITAKEAGGITQHIGASVVELNNKKITFLDTPGHEAFTAMRMRGAQVTDIAILVVAADDGVMPQTIEAINHAKAAEVQIIVAINKMDKPGANPDRVKQELSEHGLVPEDWGGETICVPVSAMTKEGIDQLLEMILLVAEMEELKANPNREARGTIVEAQLDKGRGTVATVLVQNGTLNVGDSIVAGSAYGRVRAMVDDKGRRVKSAGPSTPVEILGLSEVPTAGERFFVTKGDKEARLVAEMVIKKDRLKMLESSQQKVSLDDLFNQIQAGNVKELNIVVKADTQGSVEAVKQSLEKLSNEEVIIRTIHGGVGAVTESDVMLASASNAIIIGFNVRPDAGATSVAEREKVDIRLYRIIYNAIEDIEAAMKGMLDPVYQEKVIGHAEIRQTFKVSGVGTIGGSYVTDGKIFRNSKVRIVRDGIVIFEGNLASLKRFKDDVKEVNQGYECGLMFEKFNDIKVGDKVEAFIMEEIPR